MVVVIIAVLTTVAVLSVGALGADHGLDAEGDRYNDVVQAASEQAGLEARDYGIWFGPSSYEVLVWIERRARWEPVPDDRLYARHAIPGDVTATLELEGRPAVLGVERPETPRVPQVLLYASGDASPYRLEFSRAGTELHWLVEGQPDGTLLVTRPGVLP